MRPRHTVAAMTFVHHATVLPTQLSVRNRVASAQHRYGEGKENVRRAPGCGSTGLFTRAGCWGALLFLTLVYWVTIPVQGIPQPGSEGAYLLVNKNLIEWAAVLLLLVFRTGEIAGLDIWLQRRREADAQTVVES